MDIPKKIHFTCKDKNNITNPIWNECLSKYRSMYTDYEIIIHDNADIYTLIEQHFPEYLEKIKQIKIGAVLADIFRYLILYLEGGIYSDLDCEPIKPIHTLLHPTYSYFHGDESRNNHFYIYKNKKIINPKWDFYHNICNNSSVINNHNNPCIMKCLGHTLNIEKKSTILCYEFHSDWVSPTIMNDPKWCYQGVGICQWFMITKPKQEIFLKMFMYCMKNIDSLIQLNKNTDYHYNVIHLSGPLGFTKIVMNNLNDTIQILPSDFFCTGSAEFVPITKNSFIRHKFTGSWLS